MLRIEQPTIKARLVAKQQESFRVGIEPTEGIDPGRQSELREATIGRAIGRELTQDSERFVKGNDHDARIEIGSKFQVEQNPNAKIERVWLSGKIGRET
jgi:hypothetical protein